MIRVMEEADVESVADLAQSARLLHGTWEPPMWAASSSARGLHPLVLRRQLATGEPALVDERAGRVDGAVLARELKCTHPLPAGPVWAVDEFFVSAPGAWTTVGRALLVALAARASSCGVAEVLVSSASTDASKAAMLADAGLRRTAWVRLRTLAAKGTSPPPGVRAVVAADEEALGRLIARPPHHRHSLRSLRPFEADGSFSHDGLALDDGAGPVGVALVSPPVAAPPGHDPSTTVIADPVELAPGSDWAADGARLVRGVEWLAASRGDGRVAIPCGPGERAKDEELAAMGYTAPLEWWTLELRTRRTAIGR